MTSYSRSSHAKSHLESGHMTTSEKFKKGILIWSCAALFYFFQFILRVSPNACTDNLMSDYGFDAATLGSIMSFYYIGYVVMQLPAGIILDRVGVRMPVLLSILMCSLGVLLFAVASSPLVLTIARFLMGFGSAFAFLTNVKVASLWFEPKHMPLFVGLTLAAGTLGAKVAGSPLVYLLSVLGWKSALQLLAFSGGLLALGSWFVIKDVKSESFQETDGLKETVGHVAHSFSEILKEPMSWVMGLYGLCMYIPLSGFCDLWGAAYIEDTFKVSRAVAADISWLVYLGVGISAPLWSFVQAKFDSYRKSLFLGAALSIITFSLVLYSSSLSLTMVSILLFVCGLGLGAQFLAFSAVSALNCDSRTATSSGVHNMMCMLSGVISQPLIGYFMDLGSVQRSDVIDNVVGSVVYSRDSYTYGLSVIVIALLIGIIACYLMRPLKSKLENES